MSLVASTVCAADYTLGIFGNANMDDTIDERDIAYLRGIINGTNEITDLADANCDKEIDDKDIIRVKQIINGEEDEITLIDTTGREVTIKKPIGKIIVLNENVLEVMRSLDLDKESIAAVSSTAASKGKFFPEFKSTLNVGTGWKPDVEKIIEMHPDIAFLYATHFVSSCDEVQLLLEDAGITVVRLDCFKPESYLEEAVKLGFILDKEDQAEEFSKFYSRCINDIQDRLKGISNEDRPRVYFEGFGDPYKVGGQGTVTHQIVDLAGGHDVFGDISGYKDIDKEEVIVRDPEIIIVQGYTRGKYGYDVNDPTWLREMHDEMSKRKEISQVSALGNHRVHVIIKELTGGKHFIAAAYLAKWFHPDLFRELDPQAIHQEYLTRFQHLDYDLDTQGVFVYPPVEEV
ncbi:MAG TPA: ABC transporter substrate-binding protein [Methanotrichaceae archaeon]|nr:ABC transporter substrate-binding protein [Methanotrichaceae archaeon]HQF17150.1 ABC transporter substrate-binding protein [Methanotrichaceae archaeon]HQI91550.1 ABC transporter substrate-binding protein [Methanotrichaceae archaeon]